MNEISQVFENEEFGKVRVVMIEGEPWFVGADIANILGYSNPTQAIHQNCKHARKVDLFAKYGHEMANPIVNVISEGDLYRLVVRSKREEAERFESWIFDEVVPSIRKTGSYSLPETEDILIARALIAAQGKIERLEAKVEEMQPKADYYDDLVEAGAATSIRDTAKEFGMHQKELVNFLIKHKCLFRDKTKYKDLHPYIKHTTAKGGDGMFVVRESKSLYNSWVGTQALITVKGKEMIRDMLREDALKSEDEVSCLPAKVTVADNYILLMQC